MLDAAKFLRARVHRFKGGAGEAGVLGQVNAAAVMQHDVIQFVEQCQKRLADVGQDRVEEVDIVHRGENYGWNVFEGFEPFSNQYRKEGRKFTPPVFAYKRKYGASVTGGFVYRGDKNSSFYGVYICGDYTSKKIFGLTQENGTLKSVRQIGSIPQGLDSFGTDEAGHIYVVGYEGMIYQMDFTTARFDEIKPEAPLLQAVEKDSH